MNVGFKIPHSSFNVRSTIELLSLSLIKASVTGSCNTVNRQPSITFGKDYKSGCMIRYVK